MRNLQEVVLIEDNGGRRSGIDRRRFLIPAYCPEKDLDRTEEVVWNGGAEKPASWIHLD